MTEKPDLQITRPVLDKSGRERSDAGKKVTVNTIGGALRNAKGVVITGPFTWTIMWRVTDSKGKKRAHPVETNPYWLVRMDANGFYLRLSQEEMK